MAVYREQKSLKKKFGKSAASKKSTGDPSCPPHVREAKHIARDIAAPANAGLVDDSSADERSGDAALGGDITPTVGEEDARSVKVVGKPQSKRASASRGVKRKRENTEELSSHVEQMPEAFKALVGSTANDSSGGLRLRR